ncbi:MAG: leucine--tRNA ligase [Candidatus Saccharibacteria bacterium]|nr:leucine--tRNA ligase [Candidatus Saccharibacteria bacterium]
MKRYNPKDIEVKWQKWWDDNKTYQVDFDSPKTKYVGMGMFNYPSGAGIHIGHAMNYTISDVMARFKRQQGYESYNPIGWDAFGLPAENFAIKTGVSPQANMATIIPGYHKQYKAMGWSNDWSKEISTHEPTYYKWTQWIFTQMFKQGLAYQDARMQWWCEKCQTVLSNEQVIDSKCWRHDSADDVEVAKREVKQWFFKITDYADELLEAIDDLNWTETVKTAQKNWIGKSKGAEVTFAVDASDEKLVVFTTRPDTLYGATFMVLAPEHYLVDKLTTETQKAEVSNYVKQATKKSEVERQASKDKTGVFTGAYATNPINQAKIPIWIADYVLVGYGTGAIMAVPAHDERDNEFAVKYNLPIIKVVDTPEDDISVEARMINSDTYNGLMSSDAREKIVADLQVNNLAESKTTFKIRDWSVSRQRYWGAPIPIINCQKCGQVLVPDDQLPVVLPELEDFQPSGDGRSALARASEWLKVKCPNCGGDAERETDTLDTYICSSWYMLRYLDPHNSEAIFNSQQVNKWLPIDFYNGADHATAHMIYARFMTRFFHKLGLIDNPEPFKKFLFNGKVTAADGQMFSKSKGNGIDPLEIINSGYGADALRTYLMFAAPLELSAKWDAQGVPGTYRFLNRVWNIVQEYLELQPSSETNNEAPLRIIHPAIKKVTSDIEEQKYNTAIAAMMQACNSLYELKAKSGFDGTTSWRQALESLVMLVAPFAPHMSEQLWHDLGHEDSVNKGHWPVWDDKFLASDTMTIAVQVNGKLRAEIEVPSDADQSAVLAAAKANQKVAGYLTSDPIKTIYVPGRLLSLVVRG